MSDKKPLDWKIVITAIICISGIEVYALSQGLNGVLLTGSVAIIAGLAGLSLPQLKLKQE